MIYFKNADKAKDLEELLKLGFDQNSFFSRTYLDKEFTELQCKPARRGFSDLLQISQTYFPETIENDLAKILVEKYNSFICQNHNLLVFLHEYHLNHPCSKPFDTRMAKKFDQDYEDCDGYSYNKILKLVK